MLSSSRWQGQALTESAAVVGLPRDYARRAAFSPAPIDSSSLSLDNAVRLLAQSGWVPPDGQAPLSAAGLQALIDGLCSLSCCDALTGLVNVRQFHAVLGRELDRVSRTGAPLALLLIDADHFKSVNDDHGHPAGDRVLQALARHVRDSIRPMDTAARYGGEEFAVILPSCLPLHAERVAERIRGAIEETPIRLEDGRVRGITVSIGGVSVAPWQRHDSPALIAAADRELYRAKREGRNRVAFVARSAADAPGCPERSTARL
jgi:diguanylate cyclase (GGDEF)-like protein